MAKSLSSLLDAKALALRTKQARDFESSKALADASAAAAESSIVAKRHAEAVESALKTLSDAGVNV